MFRSIGAFIAFVSALLCIGVIVLGVRSRHHADVFVIETPGGHIAGMAGDHGAVLLANSDMSFTGSNSIDGTNHPYLFSSLTIEEFKPILDTIVDTTTTKFSFLGFKTAAGQATMTSQISPRFAALRIPCWFLGIVFAILPLGIGRSILRRSRRKRKGLCLACGYDLRFSEGRCPECGRDIPARTSSAGIRAAT
ncbi:MAG TPA: hypothetical protein VFE47_24735 [Tepidisphaeraceae bacterium]|jgi:hypothetical protein|nr:hypothetical protein [Tepidisphaeraceae bacterium]